MDCRSRKFRGIQFYLTDENCKFELYTDFYHEFSFTELKDELQEILGISDISPEHLQDKILGPRVFKAYRKPSSEKRQTDGY